MGVCQTLRMKGTWKRDKDAFFGFILFYFLFIKLMWQNAAILLDECVNSLYTVGAPKLNSNNNNNNNNNNNKYCIGILK